MCPGLRRKLARKLEAKTGEEDGQTSCFTLPSQKVTFDLLEAEHGQMSKWKTAETSLDPVRCVKCSRAAGKSKGSLWLRGPTLIKNSPAAVDHGL